MPVSSSITTVDTVQIRPAAEAFSSGKLVMPDVPVEITASGGGATWAGDPVNEILIVIFTILCILFLRRIVNVLPYIFKGVFRGKWLENLESSMRLVRERNSVTPVLAIPLCLFASRYELYAPEFIEDFTPGIKTLVIIGVFVIYVLIRQAVLRFPGARRISNDSLGEAAHCWNDWIVLSSATLIITLPLLILTSASPTLTGRLSFYYIAATALVFFFREWGFLADESNQLTAFLYLCTLEIIPIGLLAASAILL